MSTPGPPNLVHIECSDGVFEDLIRIQKAFGYLPDSELTQIAARRGINLCDIHAVASYYPRFRLSRPPKVEVRLCQDLPCHLRGASKLKNRLEEDFKEKAADELAIGNASCLGYCDSAPAFTINSRCYHGVSSGQAVNLLAQTLKGHAPSESISVLAEISLRSDPYQGKRQYSAVREFLRSRELGWARKQTQGGEPIGVRRCRLSDIYKVDTRSLFIFAGEVHCMQCQRQWTGKH